MLAIKRRTDQRQSIPQAEFIPYSEALANNPDFIVIEVDDVTEWKPGEDLKVRSPGTSAKPIEEPIEPISVKCDIEEPVKPESVENDSTQ